MGLFSTKFAHTRQNWETPDSVFVPLNDEFHFTLDVCASADNTKCPVWFEEKDNALLQKWTGVCWMNPPFGTQKDWVKKAVESAQQGATVVCLLPARTNTNWWHDYCLRYGEIRYVRGRPIFKGAKYGLPQPLVIVIFRSS